MLFGVLKRHSAWGPSPNNWKYSPKEAPHHFQELGPLALAALMMIRLSVSSDVKTTLQSDVQLDEMLAAEPYKSVRKKQLNNVFPRCSAADMTVPIEIEERHPGDRSSGISQRDTWKTLFTQ